MKDRLSQVLCWGAVTAHGFSVSAQDIADVMLYGSQIISEQGTNFSMTSDE